MYLHLAEDTIVKTKDIIGIFDLDTTTVMKASRTFINKAEKEKRTVTVSFELPKSFVVCKGKEEKENVLCYGFQKVMFCHESSFCSSQRSYAYDDSY